MRPFAASNSTPPQLSAGRLDSGSIVMLTSRCMRPLYCSLALPRIPLTKLTSWARVRITTFVSINWKSKLSHFYKALIQDKNLFESTVNTWKRAWTMRTTSKSEYCSGWAAALANLARAPSSTDRTCSSRTRNTFRRAWFSMNEDWLER